MAPPTAEEVKVAVAALRSDATVWTTASDEIETASGTAKNLVLGEPQFGWICGERGITTSYAALQAKLGTLLGDASKEFDKVAGALRLSADTYEREDREGAHNLNSVGG